MKQNTSNWRCFRARLGTGMAAVALAANGVVSASAQIAPQPIPRSELKQKCGLDPDIMAGVDNYLLDSTPYVLFRNGYFCWKSSTALTDLLRLHEPSEVYSTTKSFGAILTGIAISRSSLRDDSLLSDWLTPAEIHAFNPAINPDARVAHVLAMTATSPSLAYGSKNEYSYDPLGVRELNILIPLIDRVIQREPSGFWGATNTRQLAAKLFQKLGMTKSNWAGLSIGFTLQSNPSDLARLGELILRKGVWNGERLVDERYVYRMTHPSFEDSNTGLGYMLWLNSAAGTTQATTDSCAPYVRWSQYPHAPFYQAPDSNGGFPFGGNLGHDVGAVWSTGMNQSSYAVHRGLDMVIGVNPMFASTMNGVPLAMTQQQDSPASEEVWRNIRPALVVNLPEFGNDEQAFCDAYSRGNWVQLREPWNPGASL